MIVDTSAVIAVLKGEPEESRFVQALAGSPSARMSAATFVETAIVVDSLRDPVMSRQLDELLSALGVEVVDTTAVQARNARAAYRDFGPRSGHPAQLNFGDCFAYALASDTTEPLLYKGDDFSHTDVRSA